MARVKRIKVRFNLSRGANYMKWKVQYANGDVSYYDPNTTQLVMRGCQLRNHKGVAKKIFEGGEKVVCAWVLCEQIDVIKDTFACVDMIWDRIRYNPRVQPNWLFNGNIADNQYFGTIASVDYGLYTEEIVMD
jgi:hypothetical protein